MKKKQKIIMDEAEKNLVGDGFNNFFAKLGMQSENLAALGKYNLGNLLSRNRAMLEAIYRTSWIAGQVIDSIAEDMTKEGINMTSSLSPDHVQELQAKITSLGLWQTICDGLKWSRLYGGSIIVILTKGVDYKEPLDIRRIARNSFKGLFSFDRWQVEPSFGDLIDNIGPEMGNPRYYTILPSSDQMTGIKIHYSRVVRLEGITMPYFQKKYDNTWGMSVIERMYDRLIAFDSATQGAAQLLYKAYLRTVGIDGLRDALSMGGKTEQSVIKMFKYIRLMQSIEGITLLDGKDTFQTHQYSFSGVSDVLMQFGQQISGATGIPLVRLFGQSPAGLSATGESDLRNYYDNINKLQESRLRVGIKKILNVMSMSLFGKALPEDFEFEFSPLWTMSDSEKSTIASSNTQAVSSAYQSGLITKKIAMKELAQQSKVSGIFTTITDKDIEEAIEEPPPGMGDIPGMGGIPGMGSEGSEEGNEKLDIEGTEKLIKEKSKQGKGEIDKDKQIVIERSLEDLSRELNNLNTIESLEEDIKHLPEYMNSIESLERQLNSLKDYSNKENTTSDIRKQIRMLEKELKKIKTFDKKSVFRKIMDAFRINKKSALPTISYQGIPIAIENPVGTIREWKDQNGKKGKTKMFYSYGYIKNTKGVDKEEVDVFIGKNPYSGNAFIIQHIIDNKYDEDKVFLGFDNETQARDAFLAHYQDYTHIGNITTLPILEFKEKIFNKEYEESPITVDEHKRAPKGGISLKGKEFKGGQFIPSEYHAEFEKKIKIKEGKISEKNNTSFKKELNRKQPITSDEKEIYNNISSMAQFTKMNKKSGNWKYYGSYDVIIKEGSFFNLPENKNPRPPDVNKGKDKECYANAARLALYNPEYIYVEGIASPEFMNFPILHAWCIDKNGNVVDPTWKTLGSVYYGIPFSTDFLRQTILKTGIWGLLPEYPRNDYDPFKNGFPSEAIIKNFKVTDAKKEETEKWVTVQGKSGKSRKILLGKKGIIKGGDVPKELHGIKIGSKKMAEELDKLSEKSDKKKSDKKEKEEKSVYIVTYPDPGRTKKEKDFLYVKRLPPKKVKNKKGEWVEKPGDLVLANGKPLPKHIDVPIPPAWQWVRINPDPKGDLLVTGIDQKGSRQPKYSKEHDRKQAIKKFNKVDKLEKVFDDIVQKTEKGFNGKTRDAALCLRLVQLTGARADSGSAEGEVVTYGSSSLEKRHIKQNKDGTITLDFIGKKGKQNIYLITDKKLISELNKNLKGKKAGQKIFDINYSDLLAFTKKISNNKFVPKIFRTKIACDTAKKAISKIDEPKNKKEYKKAVAAVGDVVAERLCNTRTVALNKYINPKLFDNWKNKSGVKDSISKDEFKEEEHPRSKSGKTAGQFVKKGTGQGGGSLSNEEGKEKIEKKESNKGPEIAKYNDFKEHKKENLNSIAINKSLVLKDVNGPVGKMIKTIQNNTRKKLDNYMTYLSTQSYALARDIVYDTMELFSDSELGKIDAQDINLMMSDFIEKLVYQEMESNRAQFTDHGIRHIVGNIQRGNELLKAMGKDTSYNKLANAFIMVNHDLGYTTPDVRVGGSGAVKASKGHKESSSQMIKQERSKWNEGKIFSGEQFDELVEIIRTHDDTKIDKEDPLGTAVRLSDNLALFAKDKLPSMFSLIKNGKYYLVEMGQRAKEGDTGGFEKLRADLYKEIDKSNIHHNLKRDLKHAVQDISYLTPKFTLGVLAGEVGEIKSEGDKISIPINYNNWDHFLQSRFDMGQGQTKKLLEDYGITDFSKTEYNIGDLVTLKVVGYKEK